MNTLVSKLVISGSVLAGVVLISSPAFAYTVEKGDTLGNIAYDNDTSVSKLAKLNPQIRDINLIYVGEEITISDSESKPASKPVKREDAEKAVTSISSDSEKELLGRLVQAEAGDEPYSGKVAVAEVVLNRVNSGQFPNTIQGVIYQSGQFSPVSDGTINNSATHESKEAVAEALKGTNYTNGALYFWNPITATNRWQETLQTTAIIGGHEFSK